SAGFMKIFGMQDFTLRLGTAIFGVLAILLVWPMKKYLSDIGMLTSAFFIATSPALVYYSRFSFHDVPFVFFYLLFVYAIFEYFDGQKNKFLYLASVALAFMFSIKEVVHMLLPGILLFFVLLAIHKGVKEHWTSGAKIIANIIQFSLFPFVFYILNLNHIIDFVNIKTGVSTNLIYASVGILFSAIVALFALFSYDRWWKKGRIISVDVQRYFLPAIIAFFVTAVLFSLFYTAGFTQTSDGLDKGLNTPISYNLQKIGQQTGHYKSIWYYARTLYLFESFILMLSIASLFLARNLFSRLFIFLSTYNLLLFSFLSYKTPWHIVYIIAPMCIAAGYAVQKEYDLLVEKNKEKIFFTIAIIFAVAITFISYQISFVKYTDESKIPYVYVQATEDFREMLEYIENSSQKFNGKNTSIDILSEEYWPLPWNLREYKNVAWHAKVIEAPTGEIAIGNKVNETELDFKLENYSKKEFHNRPGVEFLVYVKH
ncbi:MAG: flippase activity-associated protein Agl23, partial [Nanoarchaeota archaeon]